MGFRYYNRHRSWTVGQEVIQMAPINRHRSWTGDQGCISCGLQITEQTIQKYVKSPFQKISQKGVFTVITILAMFPPGIKEKMGRQLLYRYWIISIVEEAFWKLQILLSNVLKILSPFLARCVSAEMKKILSQEDNAGGPSDLIKKGTPKQAWLSRDS